MNGCVKCQADYAGAFPIGNRCIYYVILAVNPFTNIVVNKAVRSATSLNASHFFVKQIPLVRGSPKELITEKDAFPGTNAKSALVFTS